MGINFLKFKNAGIQFNLNLLQGSKIIDWRSECVT